MDMTEWNQSSFNICIPRRNSYPKDTYTYNLASNNQTNHYQGDGGGSPSPSFSLLRISLALLYRSCASDHLPNLKSVYVQKRRKAKLPLETTFTTTNT